MQHSFATAQSTVLPIGRAEVFFDGVFSEPRLQHPEGIAVGPDGWIWCGSENGEILRIAPDGARIELIARAGGFTLGLAFEGDRALFFCDNKDMAVYRLDLASRRVARFTPPGVRIPNYRSSTLAGVASWSRTATISQSPARAFGPMTSRPAREGCGTASR